MNLDLLGVFLGLLRYRLVVRIGWVGVHGCHRRVSTSLEDDVIIDGDCSGAFEVILRWTCEQVYSYEYENLRCECRRVVTYEPEKPRY